MKTFPAMNEGCIHKQKACKLFGVFNDKVSNGANFNLSPAVQINVYKISLHIFIFIYDISV